MLPVILGLGGLAAKVAAAAVIPRIFRAISRCISTTTPTRPPDPVSVERISMASDAPQTTAKWGVSPPQPRSRKWGWAGLWHHAPSGLDLATFRVYDSTMGRWISRDPLGEGSDRTLYSYCGNNPVGYSDPSGLLKRRPGANGANGPLDVKIAKEGLTKIQASTDKFIASQGTDGEMAHVMAVEATTNDGKSQVKMYKNVYPEKKPGFNRNCHGQTFGDGQFWINNDQVDLILTGDGYELTDQPTVGDVAIYRKDGKVVHSMTVSEVGDDGVSVTGVAGTNVEPYTAPAAAGPNGGWPDPEAQVEYYHLP